MMKYLQILITMISIMALSSPCIAASSHFSLGAASLGANYYLWSTGFLKVLSKSAPEIKINVEVTGGAPVNTRAVNNNDMDFGCSNMASLLMNAKGYHPDALKKFPHVRSVLPMANNSVIMFALQKSGIKSFSDLNGKIVAVGPKAGIASNYYPEWFKMFNVKPEKLINSAMGDIATLLGDGIVDAACLCTGHPSVQAQETEAVYPINTFMFNMKQMEELNKKFAYWTIGEIPGGAYKDMPDAEPGLQYWAILVCNESIPDDIVYKITKAYFENLKEFELIYPPAMDVKPEDIFNTGFAIHPGAARYYEEIGVKIPDHLKVE